MVKRKFGDALRAKTRTAQVNELLLKFVCHNLCVLVQEVHELGIAPVFWTDTGPGGDEPRTDDGPRTVIPFRPDLLHKKPTDCTNNP